LMLCDVVLAKLDSYDQHSLEHVDIPESSIVFSEMIKGMKKVRQQYKGKFALQIMFMEENKSYAKEIAECARDIAADEIQINTPLRPGGATPLGEGDLAEIKKYFKGLPAKTIYESKRKKIQPIDYRDTVLRHGNFK